MAEKRGLHSSSLILGTCYTKKGFLIFYHFSLLRGTTGTDPLPQSVSAGAAGAGAEQTHNMMRSAEVDLDIEESFSGPLRHNDQISAVGPDN